VTFAMMGGMDDSTPRPAGDPLPPRHHVTGSARETDAATTVVSYLIGGPVTFGGLGWLLDRWWDTSFMVVVGLLVGMALSLYVVWLRYGSP
jgi:ATP synthase protein I